MTIEVFEYAPLPRPAARWARAGVAAVVGYVVAPLVLQVIVVVAFGVETKQMPLEMLEDDAAGGRQMQPAAVTEAR